MSEKTFGRLVVMAALALCLGGVFVSCTPQGRGLWNNWFHDVQKVDDSTRYATRKQVEDTCRAMLSSHQADSLNWRQYKGADGEKGEWAEQAKMRANRTAAAYNEYVLKNSYVWSGNVPRDIRMELSYLD